MRSIQFGKMFLCSLGILFLVSCFLPEQTISARENRTLTIKPSVSLTDFLDSSFQSQYEKAQSDQFLLRDQMTSLKHRIDVLLGSRQIGDVLIGSNQELYQVPAVYEETKMHTLAQNVSAFCNAYEELSMSFLLVPNKLTIQTNNIPAFAAHDQQSEITAFYDALPDTMQKIDAIKPLRSHQDEEIYYHGDHHVTSLGAYVLAQTYLDARGIEDTMTYTPRKLQDAFYGTLANATGFAIADTIEIYQLAQDIDVLVNYVEEKKKTTSVYACEKATSANPYEVFLDGNHALIEITTATLENRNLLLFKDSYANSFIPFLLPYYHKIVVVDPRYYYEDIASLISAYGIQEVLFLYNANTLFEDTSLLHLLEEEFAPAS